MDFEPFGKYLLLHTSDSDDFVEVCLARRRDQVGPEELVVVKRVRPERAGGQDFSKAFADRARCASAISHPNLARVLDFGRVDDSLFIAMEHIAGQDLAHVIRVCRKKSQRLPFALLARIFMDACAGLHHAHTLRDASGAPLDLIHRDVCPGNLLVGYDGITRVLDVGLAKPDAALTKTVAGTARGKYGYLAPEQIKLAPLDARADIWALGAVLWEALTLRCLFVEPDEMTLYAAIAGDSIPPPSEVVADIPRGLVQITMRALARDPGRRYSNAEQMRKDLEAFLQAQPGPATAVEVAASIQELFAERYLAHRKMLSEVLRATPVQLADLMSFEDEVTLVTFSGVSRARNVRDNFRRRRRVKIAAVAGAITAVLVFATGALLLRLTRDPFPHGTLRVETEPPGAAIFLDGIRRRQSPLTISQVPANVEHVLVAELEGHAAASQPFTLEADGVRTLQLVLQPKVEAPPKTKLSVTSAPVGATVIRTDTGEVLGATPLERELPRQAAAIELRVELAGHKPELRSVPGDTNIVIDVALERAKAKVAKKRAGKRQRTR